MKVKPCGGAKEHLLLHGETCRSVKFASVESSLSFIGPVALAIFVLSDTKELRSVRSEPVNTNSKTKYTNHCATEEREKPGVVSPNP